MGRVGSGFTLVLAAEGQAEISEGALALPGMQSVYLPVLSGQGQSLGQGFAWQWMS